MTKFLDEHPGGDEVLLSATGTNLYDLFQVEDALQVCASPPVNFVIIL